jgi:hypothetical protein
MGVSSPPPLSTVELNANCISVISDWILPAPSGVCTDDEAVKIEPEFEE